jgi:hypothetical protein
MLMVHKVGYLEFACDQIPAVYQAAIPAMREHWRENSHSCFCKAGNSSTITTSALNLLLFLFVTILPSLSKHYVPAHISATLYHDTIAISFKDLS